jgi:hypothetical protein
MRDSANGYCEAGMKRCEYCYSDRVKRSDGMEQDFQKCKKTGKRIRRDTACPINCFQKK